jgi:hypothetical protein
MQHIVHNERPKGKNKLTYTRPQQKFLVNQASYYMLDVVLLTGKEDTSYAVLSAIFKELKAQGLKPDKRQWKESEIRKIRPTANLEEIDRLFI